MREPRFVSAGNVLPHPSRYIIQGTFAGPSKTTHVKPRLDRAVECRLAEVVQPSGSLVIVREPSALTLIVPAPARFSCS